MLYIATALYQEATPWIQAFSLKKNNDFTRFQVFSNEKICVLVTGTGPLHASIAITVLFEQNPPGPNDLLINFGLCGCSDLSVKKGTCFLCNQLTDTTTMRDLYPDMLYTLPFQEARVYTSPILIDSSLMNQLQPSHTLFLGDMEAYALMYAASYHMQAHQMLFFKIVSDYMTVPLSSQDLSLISKWLSNAVQQILSLPLMVTVLQAQPLVANDSWTTRLTCLYSQLIDDLAATETMKHTLRQHINYYRCRHEDIEERIEQFLSVHPIHSCKLKTERKQYYEQLKQLLME